METSALAQSASDRYPQVASPIHTILVLAAIGGWAIWHKIFADQLSAAANPNRVRFYLVTLFYEWLLFVLVVEGVRRSERVFIVSLGHQITLCPSPLPQQPARTPLRQPMLLPYRATSPFGA